MIHMVSSRSTSLPRSFWRLVALALFWEGLPPGVYFLFAGNLGWGILLTVFGLASMLVALSETFLRWAETRVVYRPLGILLMVYLVLLIPVEIWIAIGAGRYDPQVQPLMFLHLSVYLGLAVLTIWSYRRSLADGRLAPRM